MSLKNFGLGKRCQRCGKGMQNLMNLSHSHRRTKKKSMPNLHKVTLTIGGESGQFRFCTKCLRIMKDTFQTVRTEVKKIETAANTVVEPKVEVPVVQTVEETVETEPVEEVVGEGSTKKSKKAPKAPKAKKESSRKKSLTELVSDEDE